MVSHMDMAQGYLGHCPLDDTAIGRSPHVPSPSYPITIIITLMSSSVRSAPRWIHTYHHGAGHGPFLLWVVSWASDDTWAGMGDRRPAPHGRCQAIQPLAFGDGIFAPLFVCFVCPSPLPTSFLRIRWTRARASELRRRGRCFPHGPRYPFFPFPFPHDAMTRRSAQCNPWIALSLHAIRRSASSTCSHRCSAGGQVRRDQQSDGNVGLKREKCPVARFRDGRAGRVGGGMV
jgi:hypothetical protein